MATTLVRNGTIATEYGVFSGSILVRDERVAAILEHGDDSQPVDEVIDASGCVILPGAVDIHCHFREPDPANREGFETGSASALAGGVTTVVEMPQATPAATTPNTFANKKGLAEARSRVDFALWAGITPDTLSELAGLNDAGAAGFKGFMSPGSRELPPIDDDQLLEALRTVSTWDGLVAVHAENGAVVARSTARRQQARQLGSLDFAHARPLIAEAEAIARAAYWAREADCRLHILHASSGTTAETVASLRRSGQRITVETCPHYLILDEEDLRLLGPLAKGTPPLRTSEERESLWRVVLRGDVDVLASDHAPYSLAEKQAGYSDIFAAPNGAPSNETMLPLILDEGIHRRGLPLTLFVRMTSSNPARLMHLYPRKGTIIPGSDADLTIVDPDTTWRITGKALHGRQKWTPYENRELRVRVKRVLVRGRTAYLDGEILIEPGYGQFLRPNWNNLP